MHPFPSAFPSLFLADFLTRLFFSPRDPFYIPTIKFLDEQDEASLARWKQISVMANSPMCLGG
jgi:hypothetical protein